MMMQGLKMSEMDDFEKELKVGFLEEAAQLIADAEQCFLVMESNPTDQANLEKIFRIAHNIKGSARAVGFETLGAFTHEFESFLLKCKNGILAINGRSVSLLLKCNDFVRECLETLKLDLAAQPVNPELVQELVQFKESSEAVTELAATAVETAAFSEQELVPEELFAGTIPDAAAFMEENVVTETHAPTPLVQPAALQAIDPFQELEKAAALSLVKVPPAPAAKSAVAAQSDESIRVSFSRLEKLLNFVGELVILQTVLKEQAYGSNPVQLRRTVDQIGKVTKEVQDLSMSLRMVPLKQTFQKMQRIVRDTSQVLGKKVNLILEGEETEVDKTVLESLSDPLVHLIRNAVDHGVEMPEARVAKGKSEAGNVYLKAFHQSGRLVIEVKDDGGGIPGERLKQKALEKGILKPGQTLTEKESIHLIFHPGFSTKTEVTEVSGRGVGMDVVKTNIEQLQGEISVETVLNGGSTFKITLPLTLAIIEGMIIKSNDEKYVIPLTHVHESVKLEKDAVQWASGIGELLLLRGETIPAIRLSSLIHTGKKANPEDDRIAIVIRTQAKPFAILVNDILGQHEVVVKKLGAEVQHLKGYGGSAILGDGKPALILELSDLIQTVPLKRVI